MATLTSGVINAIVDRVRVPNKIGLRYMLTQIAAAIAADIDAEVSGDIAAAISAAITAELGAEGDITAAIEGALAAIQAGNIPDLNQDISATYVEAEVQAISDKVDTILGALKTNGIIAADI